MLYYSHRKPVDVYKKPTKGCVFQGDHGYDNKFSSMQVKKRNYLELTNYPSVKLKPMWELLFIVFIYLFKTVFVAYGPTFKYKSKVPPFENIELYNVMCGK